MTESSFTSYSNQSLSTMSIASSLPRSISASEAQMYLPKIVRTIGDDVIVKKVRLQCTPLSEGRYKYTYTVDLERDGKISEDPLIGTMVNAVGKNNKEKKGKKRSVQDDLSIQSFLVVKRPEKPKEKEEKRSGKEAKPSNIDTAKEIKETPTTEPSTAPRVTAAAAHPMLEQNADLISTINSSLRPIEDEDSAKATQVIMVTFFLFGQTERGDYFRRRLSDSFLAFSSIRRAVRQFAADTDYQYRDLLDKLYYMPGTANQLKDVSKWKKISRKQLGDTVLHFTEDGQNWHSEVVLIADLLGVYDVGPSVLKQKSREVLF